MNGDNRCKYCSILEVFSDLLFLGLKLKVVCIQQIYMFYQWFSILPPELYLRHVSWRFVPYCCWCTKMHKLIGYRLCLVLHVVNPVCRHCILYLIINISASLSHVFYSSIKWICRYVCMHESLLRALGVYITESMNKVLEILCELWSIPRISCNSWLLCSISHAQFNSTFITSALLTACFYCFVWNVNEQ